MSTTALQSNPLYNYRKSDNPADGHFMTQREDVYNDNSMLNVYPNDFTYRVDSTLEIDIALWEDLPRVEAQNQFLKMTGRDHFNVAMADDWDVNPRVAAGWKRDAGGRLTFGGFTTNTFVVMWRTGEAARASSKKSLRMSDEIQKSAEQREAELQDKLSPLNAHVSVSVEDDDGTDEPSRPVRKRR